jgi:hypothetical protein
MRKSGSSLDLIEKIYGCVLDPFSSYGKPHGNPVLSTTVRPLGLVGYRCSVKRAVYQNRVGTLHVLDLVHGNPAFELAVMRD